MALPALLRKIFESDGYGPKLNRSVIPYATALAANSADDVVSTNWARNWALSAVYVATPQDGGNDANDGLVADRPVATFARALQVAAVNPVVQGRAGLIIYVKAGTYNLTGLNGETGGILADGIAIQIGLLGNVTLNLSDCLCAVNGGFLRIDGASYDLTINSANSLLVHDGSFYCGVNKLTYTATSAQPCFQFFYSDAKFDSYVDLNQNSGSIFLVTESSRVRFEKSVSCDGDNYSHACSIQENSVIHFSSTFYVNFNNKPITGLGAYCFHVTSNSCVFFNSDVSIQTPTANLAAVGVDFGGIIVFKGYAHLRCNNQSNKQFVLIVGQNAIVHSVTYLSIDCSATIGSGISVLYGGNCHIEGTLEAAGAYTNYFLRISSNGTYTSRDITLINRASGKSLYMNMSSSYDANGVGTSKLPGDGSASVNNYSTAY